MSIYSPATTAHGRDYHGLIPWHPPIARQPQISPYPQIGQVVAHDPPNRQMQVLFRNGQILTVSAPGPGKADALRANNPPLPGLMTDGLVLFPHGDMRGGTWVTSINRNLTDATNADAASPHDDYHADWGGGWRWLAQDGDHAQVWADTSSFVLGFSGAVPTTFRHVVAPAGQDSQGNNTSNSASAPVVRKRIELTQEDRRPSPPSPYPLAVKLANGMQYTVDGSGNIALTTAASGSFTMTVNSAVISIDSSGSVKISAPAGQSILVDAENVNLGGMGGPAVARIGDQVTTPSGIGTITTGSLFVKCA